MNIVVLFRLDLRLHDHPALYQAAQDGMILPIFVLEDGIGAASKYWIHQNLQSLQKSFKELGGNLYVSNFSLPETIEKLQKELKIDAIYYNRSYHPDHFERDEKFNYDLGASGVIVETFEGAMLLPPSDSLKENGEPYKVFTPFYKQFRLKTVPPVVPRVKKATFMSTSLSSSCLTTNINSLQLTPTKAWTKGIDAIWKAGEQAGIELIETFIEEDVAAYKTQRDFPFLGGTSRISPYLAVGALSVRSVYHHALKMAPETSESFIRQLIWREFAYQLLVHYPELLYKPMNQNFEKFPWQNKQDHFEKWCKGQTGIPLIDAGMRELWWTGYMHNRVRMNAASYLTKHLLIDFTKGMSWFLDTLIDSDIANNTFGWQWASGTGADASPYFRIFNPYLQSEKFDTQAGYIRKWVPELKDLSTPYIFQPDQAPEEVLEKAGVILDETYPRPIVTHKSGRTRALLAYKEIKI